MCSYNRVNNSYSCQNSKLLNGLLKTELGFEGFVTSDWGAQRKSCQDNNVHSANLFQIPDYPQRKLAWMWRCLTLRIGEFLEEI